MGNQSGEAERRRNRKLTTNGHGGQTGWKSWNRDSNVKILWYNKMSRVD